MEDERNVHLKIIKRLKNTTFEFKIKQDYININYNI